jgi:hypothetical protein
MSRVAATCLVSVLLLAEMASGSTLTTDVSWGNVASGGSTTPGGRAVTHAGAACEATAYPSALAAFSCPFDCIVGTVDGVSMSTDADKQKCLAGCALFLTYRPLGVVLTSSTSNTKTACDTHFTSVNNYAVDSKDGCTAADLSLTTCVKQCETKSNPNLFVACAGACAWSLVKTQCVSNQHGSPTSSQCSGTDPWASLASTVATTIGTCTAHCVSSFPDTDTGGRPGCLFACNDFSSVWTLHSSHSCTATTTEEELKCDLSMTAKRCTFKFGSWSSNADHGAVAERSTTNMYACLAASLFMMAPPPATTSTQSSCAAGFEPLPDNSSCVACGEGKVKSGVGNHGCQT